MPSKENRLEDVTIGQRRSPAFIRDRCGIRLIDLAAVSGQTSVF